MPNLPARPSLENIKKQAKQLLKAVKLNEPDALALVGPYFDDPSKITLQQAQLVLARSYKFSSWLKLKQHVEASSPQGPTTDQLGNYFLELVCLHYGHDKNNRNFSKFQDAAELLQQYPQIAGHSIYTAVALGDVDAVRAHLADNPNALEQTGGPFPWTPLMYAAYARLPGVSTFPVGQILLEAGADPNAHHIMNGRYRFTVLTGIFGDGEGGKALFPEHPDMEPFARATLEKGAHPNECQGAYNRCFNADNTHLELMLEYGLKDSDPSDWWLSEPDQTKDAHRTMHFHLIMALRFGFAARARLLIAHGVDLNKTDANYYQTPPISYTPYQAALLHGLPDIAALIKAKGGDSTPLKDADQFRAACMAGDLETAKSLSKPLMGQDPDAEATLLREAASNGNLKAVQTMIELGFPLSPAGKRSPLHAAAWRGHVEIVEALLFAGADPKQRDPDHFSPPLGHALRAQNQRVIDVLMKADMDIFLAAAMGNTEQIDARLAENLSWINAPFSRVRPKSEKDLPNDWAPPLWYAAINGQIETVRYLLKKGADPRVKDNSGRSIADHVEPDHPEIAGLLRHWLSP